VFEVLLLELSFMDIERRFNAQSRVTICEEILQGPSLRTMWSGVSPASKGICNALVSSLDGNEVLWPIPVVSSARTSPSAPPTMYTPEEGSLGKVT
jgi:hypothetical protein